MYLFQMYGVTIWPYTGFKGVTLYEIFSLPRDVNELRIFQRELTNFFYYEVKLKVNNL